MQKEIRKKSNWNGNVVFFNANRTLTNYLRSIGFNFKAVDSSKQYYVNHLGCQVRIDSDQGEITLINRFGYVLQTGTKFSRNRLDEFSKGIKCEHKIAK